MSSSPPHPHQILTHPHHVPNHPHCQYCLTLTLTVVPLHPHYVPPRPHRITLTEYHHITLTLIIIIAAAAAAAATTTTTIFNIPKVGVQKMINGLGD